MAKRIVLLGAGHAHLFSLRRLWRFAEAGHETVVVAPGRFWYSGLATAVLSGRHPPERDVIDVARLVRQAGGRFIEDTVTSIDPSCRTVHLAGGAAVPYDLLSLSLGSVVPDLSGVVGADASSDDLFAVKPIARLWHLRQRLCRQGGPAPRVVLAGGGITAAEVAANLLALGRPIELVIVAGGPMLAGQPRPIARHIEALLIGRGAVIRRDARVTAVDGHAAVLADGQRLAFDVFVNATGLIPPPLIRSSGLPVDPKGGLMVDATLRCIDDPAVFGGGDCIAFDGRTLPRAGVFGVRQGPVLFHNLLAAMGRGTARPYRPQRRYLWIMNLGDGTGLASWSGLEGSGLEGAGLEGGGLHWRGRLALRLKDAIDLRFLRAFQDKGPP